VGGAGRKTAVERSVTRFFDEGRKKQSKEREEKTREELSRAWRGTPPKGVREKYQRFSAP